MPIFLTTKLIITIMEINGIVRIFTCCTPLGQRPTNELINENEI